MRNRDFGIPDNEIVIIEAGGGIIPKAVINGVNIYYEASGNGSNISV